MVDWKILCIIIKALQQIALCFPIIFLSNIRAMKIFLNIYCSFNDINISNCMVQIQGIFCNMHKYVHTYVCNVIMQCA